MGAIPIADLGESWASITGCSCWRTDLFAATLNVPVPPVEAVIAPSIAFVAGESRQSSVITVRRPS